MYKVQQNEAKAYEKLSGNLDMDISIMINSKQRRHIHEKWQFGQGGPGVAQGCQEVANHSEGLGGGVVGHGYIDDISTKSGDLGKRAWGGTGGAKR